VKLLFLSLPSVEMASPGRRAGAAGGHDVPEAVIRRRFAAGRANLTAVSGTGKFLALYDNSGEVRNSSIGV